MAVLKEEEFDGFLKRRISGCSVLLIHGDDEAVISSMGAQAIAALSGSTNASMLVDELDTALCKKSPGIFADALNGMSLLGDRRLLVLDGVDDSCLAFLTPALEPNAGGNFILLKANALRKDSNLRSGFESAGHAAVVTVFPDDERVATQRARNILQAQNMAWGDGAEETFFNLVGFERAIVAQELNKLALYCFGASIIEESDVNAVCGDLAEDSLDDAIDAILAGDLARIDLSFGGATGREAKSVLPLLAMHLGRLINLNAAVASGQTVDNAVRSAKPPVFFKRRAAVVNQLNRLKLEDLIRLQATVQSLVLKSRQLGAIAESATARSLLSMSRNLRSNSG